MKKILLVCSLVITLLFSANSIVQSKTAENLNNETSSCSNPEDSSVRILNSYGLLASNGFVYKVDDTYAYIITSSNITKKNNYKVMYQSGKIENVSFVGQDNHNGITVLKTNKAENINGVCMANSDYLKRGQLNYAYGYTSVSNDYYIQSTINTVGDLYYSKNYINVYKTIISLESNEIYKGSIIFDELNRVIGALTSVDDKLEGGSYITVSNRLTQIADSIIKTGKYSINYIKYNLEDYSGLNSVLKKSYDVSGKVNGGVVITTFRPFNFLFGGLNQGMAIVAINGVEINNSYELDLQLSRYKKNDNVCLKVIKKNGKKAFYHVTV